MNLMGRVVCYHSTVCFRPTRIITGVPCNEFDGQGGVLPQYRMFQANLESPVMNWAGWHVTTLLYVSGQLGVPSNELGRAACHYITVCFRPTWGPR